MFSTITYCFYWCIWTCNCFLTGVKKHLSKCFWGNRCFSEKQPAEELSFGVFYQREAFFRNFGNLFSGISVSQLLPRRSWPGFSSNWIFLKCRRNPRPTTSWRRDFNTGVFQWTLQHFYEHLFWRTSTSGYFCSCLLLISNVSEPHQNPCLWLTLK